MIDAQRREGTHASQSTCDDEVDVRCPRVLVSTDDRGAVGGNVFGAKILLLTTAGRKTGKRYTTPLLYLEEDDMLIVIASNNGSDSDPNWWRNLNAYPAANVQVGGEHLDVHAEAAAGEERARLWEMITKRYRVYRDYERRTKREIPVVVLRR